jgi:hypothetical protein
MRRLDHHEVEDSAVVAVVAVVAVARHRHQAFPATLAPAGSLSQIGRLAATTTTCGRMLLSRNTHSV